MQRHVVGDPAPIPRSPWTSARRVLTDFKSAFRNWPARKLPLPRYVIVRERGPEHAKTFTMEVRVGKDWTRKAEGYSKKNAAQNAAHLVLTSRRPPADKPADSYLTALLASRSMPYRDRTNARIPALAQLFSAPA